MSGRSTKDEAAGQVTWRRRNLLVGALGLAADLRGASEPTKVRLLRAVTSALGIDTDRCLRNMASMSTAERLVTSLSLGRALDVRATPALVTGRTIILGAACLRAIARGMCDERATAGDPCTAPAPAPLESGAGSVECDHTMQGEP